MAPLTLFFLQASRSIRTAWLLEELGLSYKLRFSERENQKAPPEFKKDSGSPLGKFPVLWDGELVVCESGAISDYLCDTYDKDNRLMPRDPQTRIKVRQWVHAAEGTFCLHALAILYARWNMPKDAAPANLEAVEKGLSANVQNDMAWLEKELSESGTNFLCGEDVTAADIMMQFSVDFILERGLGVRKGEWVRVEEWLERCKGTEGYKKAVERTGYRL